MRHQDVLEGLRLGPRLLRELVQAIPPEALERRRGEGFWTLREHLEHLVEVQPMLYGRLERFLSEERPQITPYVPGPEREPREGQQKPPGELLELFERWRLRQSELIGSAPAQTWTRQADHPEYERYGFEILVRHILLHDYTHMYRMEELWLMSDKALAGV